MVNDWDQRFLTLAQTVASWSKDPSTQVGAVIVDEDRRLVSVGFNGFAKHVGDNPERYADRDTKMCLIIHAELNAILFAKRSLVGCTLYTWPFPPCARCAGPIIQVGIRRCVAPAPPAQLAERWCNELEWAAVAFAEAGVLLEVI